MRVSELANELGKTSKEVLDIIKQKDSSAALFAASSVSKDQENMVRNAVSQKKEGKTEPAKKKLTAVFRPQNAQQQIKRPVPKQQPKPQQAPAKVEETKPVQAAEVKPQVQEASAPAAESRPAQAERGDFQGRSQNGYQGRDNRGERPQGGYQNRDGRNGSYQGRDNNRGERPQGGYQNRDGRNGGYQGRDNNRGDRPQGGYQNRDGRPQGGFQNRDRNQGGFGSRFGEWKARRSSEGIERGVCVYGYGQNRFGTTVRCPDRNSEDSAELRLSHQQSLDGSSSG